jgi:hypothetical protein
MKRTAWLSEPDEQSIVGSDDDPRWRSPEAGHGVDTAFENRSAADPRSFAADAHDCIMAQVSMDLPDTRLWRDDSCPLASSPLIIIRIVPKRTRVSDLSRCCPARSRA